MLYTVVTGKAISGSTYNSLFILPKRSSPLTLDSELESRSEKRFRGNNSWWMMFWKGPLARSEDSGSWICSRDSPSRYRNSRHTTGPLSVESLFRKLYSGWSGFRCVGYPRMQSLTYRTQHSEFWRPFRCRGMRLAECDHKDGDEYSLDRRKV
jgi:hypothetical protein